MLANHKKIITKYLRIFNIKRAKTRKRPLDLGWYILMDRHRLYFKLEK
jgi:hypothetical protein